MIGHQYQRMPLCVLGHLVEATSFDIGKKTSHDCPNHHGKYCQQRRIHARRNFTVGLGHVTLGLFLAAPLRSRPLGDCRLDAFVGHDHRQNALGGSQGGSFDNLLSSIKVDQEGAPNRPSHTLLPIITVLRHVAEQIDGLADLHRQAPVGQEK